MKLLFRTNALVKPFFNSLGPSGSTSQDILLPNGKQIKQSPFRNLLDEQPCADQTSLMIRNPEKR